MTDDLTNWIKQQSKLLYPDFYDGTPANSKLADGLIDTANNFIGDRSKQLAQKDQPLYNNIMLYLTLTLMWNLEHAEGNPTAVKAGSVDVELANAANPYAGVLKMFLELIGWNVWKADIF